MTSERTPGGRRPRPPVPPKLARANIASLTGGAAPAEEDLIAASPVEVPAEPSAQAAVLFGAMFRPGDLVNVVGRYNASMDEDGDVRISPRTPGWTKSAEFWCRYFQQVCVPGCHAGCWYRINPVNSVVGSGAGGAHRDRDVAGHDKVLVEFDNIPVETQLAFFARSPLPIMALVHSGGKSVHAILRISCLTATGRKRIVGQLYECLRMFGADTANTNVSRFSRLPGAHRTPPGGEPAMQRLLYLDPEANPDPILRKP